MKVINAFGKELNNFKLELNYKVSEPEQKVEQVKKDKDSMDLEDEAETQVESSNTATFENQSRFKLDVSQDIKKPIVYNLGITAKFALEEKSYLFNYSFPIKSFSKIRINNLKLSVTNTSEKNDEKETLIDYPKRSFKNIKATQKSVIKLKVNVS